VTRLAERLVEAHHVDVAEFMHLMTMAGLALLRLALAAHRIARRVLRL
jgi:hypothetical protein